MNVLEERAASDFRARLYVFRSPKSYQPWADREGETWENTGNCFRRAALFVLLPNIIGMLGSRRMRWEVHVAPQWYMRNIDIYIYIYIYMGTWGSVVVKALRY